MALWDNNQGKWNCHDGATLSDSSPNNYSLSRTGSGDSSVAGHGGTAGDALSTGGGGAYWSIADASAPNLKITGPLTMSAWVYPSGMAASHYYAAMAKWGATNGASSYYLGVYATSTSACNIYAAITDGTTGYGATGSITMNAGTWYHIAAVYDGTNFKLYVNGILDISIAGPTSINNSTTAFELGAQVGASNQNWKGYLDDSAVWNRALSSSEISALSVEQDDFVAGYSVSGVIRDKAGNAINCATYNTRINLYPVNNTASASVKTLLNTASDGTWFMGTPSAIKYLVEFEYEGIYLAPSDIDIAGAQFMTAA